MDGIRHGSDVPESVGFWTGLFFSVQSSETIGFGYLSPAGSGTNIVVVIEAYYAQMSYAVLTGVRSTLLIVGVGVVVALPVISALCDVRGVSLFVALHAFCTVLSPFHRDHGAGGSWCLPRFRARLA